MDRSWEWIEKNYPGIFETIICTGQSQETLSDNEVLTKLSKADVRSRYYSRCVVLLNARNPEIGLQKTQSEGDD